MNLRVRNKPLRSVAQSHLRENLRKSANDHSVSAELLARIQSLSLSFTAIAFRDLSEHELGNLRFAYGRRGEAYRVGFDGITASIEQAAAFFGKHEEGVCVLEHSVGRRTDKRVRALAGNVRYFGDEVYSVIPAIDARSSSFEDEILEAWRANWFTGFFLSGCPPEWLEKENLPRDFPVRVCEDFRIIFTEAFDGEGLLLAERVS